MLISNIKSKIPLLFLLLVSVSWAFYYGSNGALNDYGAANFEWLYLLDVLVVLPLLCVFCFTDYKTAMLKALVLCSAALVIASFIIPQDAKNVMFYIDDGRYFVIGFLLLFELIALLTVYFAIAILLKQQHDPDQSIEQTLKRYLGDSPIVSWLSFETRLWTFALFARHIEPTNYAGQAYFTYHRKDGAQSNLLGFIILIAIEIPVVHLLLHFLWSPLVATVITVITFLSLIFFFAEYRALPKRPIAITGSELLIRVGLYPTYRVTLTNVQSVSINRERVARQRHIKRYNYAGVPNVVIRLKQPQGQISAIYLGLDDPKAFKQYLDQSCLKY
ncbi:hypothetical protein [Alteromonas flava]|uniref:hypothetical protein n=1 Tax=Alteromonas flava TaxID=2048003 RepID=UPI000C293163|nr:hypothetical protein [Alteromonas flava]